MPDTAGRYYLTKDVVISETWQPADGTVLCLNGKTITGEAKDKYVIYITNGSFDLTDCAGIPEASHMVEVECSLTRGRLLICMPVLSETASIEDL